MINPSELRVGNFVFESKKSTHIYCIESLRKPMGMGKKYWVISGIACPHKKEDFSSLIGKNINPCGIPLTEEWLTRFGFEVTKEVEINGIVWMEYNLIDFMGICYEQNKGVQFDRFYIYGGGGQDYSGETSIKETVKYVHDLQNFIYSITKEEAQIKL